MKKLIFAILLALFSFACYADIRNFSAREIYVGYYFADNYANVIEYDVVHTGKSRDIRADVQLLEDSIMNAEFAKNKYEYDYFSSAEESISNEGNFVKINLDLICSETASFDTMEDLLSKTLGRPVTIKVEGEKLNVYFEGAGIQIRSNNAEGAYRKGDTILMSWPSRLSKMELVFGVDTVVANKIDEYVAGKKASPEKTSEEIDFMKNALPELEGVERRFQDDCDIIRLKDLVYYGKLIEAYKAKIGKYPFAQTNRTVYSLIYNNMQKQYAVDTNPNEHVLVSPRDFFQELEKGLGAPVNQHFDPQYVPLHRPVFYIYMVEGDEYFFAVHVSKYYSFSKKVASHYYKVEISSGDDLPYKIYSVDTLASNPKYTAAVLQQVSNEKFFEEREEKHRQEY